MDTERNDAFNVLNQPANVGEAQARQGGATDVVATSSISAKPPRTVHDLPCHCCREIRANVLTLLVG